MRRFLTGVSVLAFIIQAADPTRERTLQRAIDLMETKGDIAKAMPLFEDVSKSSDHALAARALLYLAQGQERQGTDRARATYERIIQEYGNETEAVAEARKRLASLGSTRSPSSLTKRLVCPDCGDSDNDVTADGRWMAITDWNSGDLAVRDLSTGQVRRLMVKTGSWEQSKSFAENVSYSPDQRHVAFYWAERAGNERRAQVRLTSVEPGAKSRVLVDNSDYSYYEPIGWTPNGRSILVLALRNGRTGELLLVSAADGSTKLLKSLGWRLNIPGGRGRQSLSPDGRYIAYSALAADPKSATGPVESTSQRIYILAVDGSSETELDKSAGINKDPVWLPDGKHVLFTSDRSGKFDLWAMGVENGRPAGRPVLAMSDAGSSWYRASSMTRGGTCYYTNAGFGVETRITGMNETFGGMRPTWSPDGKRLAFTRPRPLAGNDAYDLVVRSLDSGEETQYSLNGIRPAPPRWLHDGTGVVVAVYTYGRTNRLYRVDLKTREFRQMFEFDDLQYRRGVYALSPDDQTIYQAGRDPKDTQVRVNRIVAIDIKTGQQKQICTVPATGDAGLALSPDGRTLAIRRVDSEAQQVHVARVSVDGSDYRELYTVGGRPKNAHIDQIAWDKEGRGILVGVQENGNWKVMRVPVDGGAPGPSGYDLKDPGNLWNISVSPDGARLAFSVQTAVRQLWAVDNLMSVVK